MIETTLLITRRYDNTINDAALIASIDLGFVGDLSTTLGRMFHAAGSSDQVRKVYLPGHCGAVERDGLGRLLTVVPTKPLLTALKRVNRTNPYRRFTMAIAMIESLATGWDDEDIEIVVFQQ